MDDTPTSKDECWKLSPNDFAFLWSECRRCYYLKHVRGFDRPRTPFPGVFSKIGSAQRRLFEGTRTETLIPELPPGVFAHGEKSVRSAPVALPGRRTTCYVSGRVDMVGCFDDGSYGVIDFKTSDPGRSNMEKYAHQLRAYTYALEHPAAPRGGLAPVTTLGLYVLNPTGMVRGGNGATYSIECASRWIPVARDDESFLGFLGEVVGVLESPEPPAASESCTMCRYRHGARETGY